MKHTISYARIGFRTIAAAFLLLLCNAFNTNSSQYHPTFKSIVSNELTNNNVGILASITSPQKQIEWSGAAGYADKETKRELCPNDQFRIASVTKTFVAVAILRLWEDKKIGLDDPISKHISKAYADTLVKGGYDPNRITIRHLLTHSGGLSEHTQSPKFENDFLKTRHIWTREEQLSDLLKYTKPVGLPGDQFSYSDTGYILLGDIIEKVTHKPMGDAIYELLRLKQLNINRTYIEKFDGDSSGTRIHQYHNGVDTYSYHPSFDYYGGGGLLSTTADLSHFFSDLFNHKVFRHKSTLDTMLTPVSYSTKQALDYRMGIWRIEINGMEAYTHSGFWGTQVVHIPAINTTLAVNYSQRWSSKGPAPIIQKLVDAIQAKTTKK
jgi:D-alanyl-D-alanine carboxypeptidase